MNPKILNAPYNAKLAKTPGWKKITDGLDIVFFDQPALNDSELSFYVNFTFMNGEPMTIGTGVEPALAYDRQHMGAKVDIFEVIRQSLDELISDAPIHEALFRYRKKEGWAVAHLYDEQTNKWDVWRDRRAELNRLRGDWFANHANPNGFEQIQEVNLEILVDIKNSGYELVPIFIGWSGDDVWMMTNGLSNPPTPRESDYGNNTKFNTELFFRCSSASIGASVDLKTSPEFQAITLMAEAFYWQYIDPENAPAVDLTNPLRLRTLSQFTGKARSLSPNTPFFLSPATNKALDLGKGLMMTPAFVTVEKALGAKLTPSLSAKLHSWSGTLGKAPSKYVKPDDTDLLTQLRNELHEQGDIKSIPLTKRMQNFAGLEFYYGRALPEDIAPYLRKLYFYELGQSNWTHHHRLVAREEDLIPERHGDMPAEFPTLDSLSVYTGLRKLDLRGSGIESLSWLTSLPWIQELSLSHATLQHFSELALAPELKHLSISNSALADLSQLAPLKKLSTLRFHDVPATDFKPLAALPQLTELVTSAMKVNDLSPLAALTQLEKLGLEGLDVSDLSWLAACQNIRWLSLAATEIEDLSTLPNLPMLEELMLHNANNVHDLSPLKRFSKLYRINATGTNVVDWSAVEFVKHVQGRP